MTDPTREVATMLRVHGDAVFAGQTNNATTMRLMHEAAALIERQAAALAAFGEPHYAVRTSTALYVHGAPGALGLMYTSSPVLMSRGRAEQIADGTNGTLVEVRIREVE